MAFHIICTPVHWWTKTPDLLNEISPCAVTTRKHFGDGPRHCACLRAVVSDSVTPWTIALCPWDYPGKNTGVGCCLLLQGILAIQGSNPHLVAPVLQAGCLPWSHQGSPWWWYEELIKVIIKSKLMFFL